MKSPNIEVLTQPGIQQKIQVASGSIGVAEAITNVANPELWVPTDYKSSANTGSPYLATVSVVRMNAETTELHTVMFGQEKGPVRIARELETIIQKTRESGPLRTPSEKELSKIRKFLGEEDTVFYAAAGYIRRVGRSNHPGIQSYSNNRTVEFYNRKRLLSRGAHSEYVQARIRKDGMSYTAPETVRLIKEVNNKDFRSSFLATTLSNYVVCCLEPDNMYRHVLEM